LWHGRIYATSRLGVLLRPPIIYRGLFGSAGFQSLYASAPALDLMFCTSLEFHALVTLPLWVLSAIFHIVLPLAITSLLITLGVCAAAGAQAGLPKNKTRWWSRPMVAALYFLQPIVRGWARYQGRLTLRPVPLAVPHPLDSVALREGKQSLDEVAYWAEQPVDRLAWVADILGRMARHGWPNKSDIGWSEYDVEVYGSRWSHLQLTTVAEEHPPGKQILRCRLRARCSLPAKVAFCLLCGLELAVSRVAAARREWWWLLALAAIPLFVWFLQREKRTLQSLCVVFLDHAAKEWKMAKV
jgi:hypothetical protein